MLLSVKTSVVRLGMFFDKVGWIAAILLRARSSVRSRGLRGKFARVEMVLSVKSIAS
jgi:hypothetical protein